MWCVAEGMEDVWVSYIGYEGMVRSKANYNAQNIFQTNWKIFHAFQKNCLACSLTIFFARAPLSEHLEQAKNCLEIGKAVRVFIL